MTAQGHHLTSGHNTNYHYNTMENTGVPHNFIKKSLREPIRELKSSIEHTEGAQLMTWHFQVTI